MATYGPGPYDFFVQRQLDEFNVQHERENLSKKFETDYQALEDSINPKFKALIEDVEVDSTRLKEWSRVTRREFGIALDAVSGKVNNFFFTFNYKNLNLLFTISFLSGILKDDYRVARWGWRSHCLY